MSKYICSSCGQEVESGDAKPPGVTCPSCQQGSGAAAANVPRSGEARVEVCAFCLSPIGAEEAVTACPACRATYHDDCWRENGGCAVYGCSQVPTVEPRKSVEIPVSYWGRESKPCPACGKEILAAAVRCRFCGATFSSAQPEDAAAFSQRTEQEKRLPGVKQRVVWIFVLSLIPCSAPIGGVWGLVWYPTHKSDVQALPSLYPALCKMGIAVGLGQTLLMALVAAIHAAARGH
jgi:DNA-directed RNA polymerase subunit RPC12/RpoP